MKSAGFGNVLKSGSSVLRVAFICVPLVMGAAIAQAQWTNNNYNIVTTNMAALTPVGTNGFGVALLGIPVLPWPQHNASNHFAKILVCGALGYEGTDTNQANGLVFHAVVGAWDRDSTQSSTHSTDVNSFNVTRVTSNLNTMQVVRVWSGIIQTNACGAATDVSAFTPVAISKNGTIALDLSGASGELCTTIAGRGVLEISASAYSQILITNFANCIWSDTGNNIDCPFISQNNNLVSIGDFGSFVLVARPDITGSGTMSPNGQLVDNSSLLSANGTRGHFVVNDSAGLLATVIKATATSDEATHIILYSYTDPGSGSITVTATQNLQFGSVVGSTINTNYINFFGTTQFDGPHQTSINDNGDVAFDVSIGASTTANGSNDLRAPSVEGILFKPSGSTSFQLVTDNSQNNAGVFWRPPSDTCTNRNLFSPPAVDNFGNVYFVASYTNGVATNGVPFACDDAASNALFEAVANTYPSPTSWTVRRLVSEGDTFTNSIGGQVIRIRSLGVVGKSGGRLSITSSAFGPNQINRSGVPGHTPSGPSDPFCLGGVMLQATLTNTIPPGPLYDSVLYVAPVSSGVVAPPGPFVITQITRTGNDVKLVWTGIPGSNFVQATAGLGDVRGSYTNANYVDVAGLLLSSAGSTNYTDVGGATNSPSRYYRIRGSQ